MLPVTYRGVVDIQFVTDHSEDPPNNSQTLQHAESLISVASRVSGADKILMLAAERESLIEEIFVGLSIRNSSQTLLSEHLCELAEFRVQGFSGDTSEWTDLHLEMCESYGWDGANGLNIEQFAIYLNDEADSGKPLCFDYNNGRCDDSGCPNNRAHRCQLCKGPHRATECPKAAAGGDDETVWDDSLIK